MLACRLVLATRSCSSAISTERSASTAMSSECRCAYALTPTRSSRPRVRSSRCSRAASCPGLIGHYAPPDPAPWPQGEVAFFVDDVDVEHARPQDAGVPVLAPPTDRPWGE